MTFKGIEDLLEVEPIAHIYKEANPAVHAGPRQIIEAANFDRSYLYGSRGEFDKRLIGRTGQAVAFLVAVGRFEILRRIVVDLEDWDESFSAAEFVHLIGSAVEEFRVVRMG